MAWPSVGSVPLLLGMLFLAGCAPEVSQVLALPEDAPLQRRLQTRQYEFAEEEQVLMACTALLQDMGFHIDEGASRLGVVLASKMRDANPLTPGERAAVGVAVFGLLAGGYTAPLAFLLIDKMDAKPVRIEVGIFTRKVGTAGNRVAVRMIFRETAYAGGRPGPSQIVKDAAVYEEAFDRLAKALALEARES